MILCYVWLLQTFFFCCSCESTRRGNFIKYLFLGYGLLENRMCSYKISNKTFLENLICSYGISFSWKILSDLTKFWTRSPGNFNLFLWYFFFLENRMCSCRILRKLSWKFWCILVHFASRGKFICVLIKELCLLPVSYTHLTLPTICSV